MDFETQRKKRMEALEEKKKRLEEIKRRNQERDNTPQLPASRNEVDDLVKELIGEPTISAPLTSPGQGAEEMKEGADDSLKISPPPRKINLSIVRGVATINIPSSTPETYEKSCQTDSIEEFEEVDSERLVVESSRRGSVRRQRGRAHTDTLANAHTSTDISSLPSTPNPSPTKAAREATKVNVDVDEIVKSASFSKFLDSSSHIIERALGQVSMIDLLRNYQSDGNASKVAESRALRLLDTYEDDAVRGRPVMDIQFSPHCPELFLVAYGSKSTSAMQKKGSGGGGGGSAKSFLGVGGSVAGDEEPLGLVYVWSTIMRARPEFKFTASSPVLTARFHDQDKYLVLGGCYTGQLLVWDLRAKALPVQRSLLAGKGHKHPVYAISIYSAAAASSDLVSVSTDGTLCHWDIARIADPTDVVPLQAFLPNPPVGAQAQSSTLDPSGGQGQGQGQGQGSSLSLNISSMVFSAGEGLGEGAKEVVLGSGVGHLYRGSLPLHSGDSLHQIDGHRGLVTSMQLNPSTNRHFKNLLLTSSLDWTVKLWNLGSSNPPMGSNSGGTGSSTSSSSSLPTVLSPLFEFAAPSYDYISDVQWSPSHAGVFSTITSGGTLTLWNLCKSTSEPLDLLRITREGGDEGPLRDTPGGGSSVSTSAMSGGVGGVGAGAPGATGALNKSAWSKDGRIVLVGDTKGAVHLVAVQEAVSKFSNVDENRLEMALLNTRELNPLSGADDFKGSDMTRSGGDGDKEDDFGRAVDDDDV